LKQPVSPGTYIGPTRANGGKWLIVMYGTPCSKQAAFTQRSMSWAGRSAASITNELPRTASPISSGVPRVRATAATRMLGLKRRRAAAATAAFGLPMSSSA
jgi:hypothetical protein